MAPTNRAPAERQVKGTNRPLFDSVCPSLLFCPPQATVGRDGTQRLQAQPLQNVTIIVPFIKNLPLLPLLIDGVFILNTFSHWQLMPSVRSAMVLQLMTLNPILGPHIPHCTLHFGHGGIRLHLQWNYLHLSLRSCDSFPQFHSTEGAALICRPRQLRHGARGHHFGRGVGGPSLQSIRLSIGQPRL